MMLDWKRYPAENLAADRRQTSEHRRPSDHAPSRVEEGRIREAGLDETLAATFPASDPPSSIPNPCHHDGTSSAGTEVGARSFPGPLY